jgi:hypothetical protein
MAPMARTWRLRGGSASGTYTPSSHTSASQPRKVPWPAPAPAPRKPRAARPPPPTAPVTRAAALVDFAYSGALPPIPPEGSRPTPPPPPRAPRSSHARPGARSLPDALALCTALGARGALGPHLRARLAPARAPALLALLHALPDAGADEPASDEEPPPPPLGPAPPPDRQERAAVPPLLRRGRAVGAVSGALAPRPDAARRRAWWRRGG